MVRLFKKIKWFIQRGKRGWADCDTWNFDTYIAGVIRGGTEYLLKHGHGYPSALTDEKWREILKEIVWAFDYLCAETDIWWKNVECFGSQYADEYQRKQRKRARKGLVYFVKYFQYLWD